MSKVITSPIEKYAGSVTIADPLTIAQARAVETGMTKPEFGEDGKVYWSVIDGFQSAGILACVEKWNLENFHLTESGELPASPRSDTHKLIAWLYSEIQKIYFGELEIPNVSGPTPISTPEATATPQS